MCINPGLLRDGTEIACRKCWQCTERRVTDWVGRCLAESKTAVATHSITLTYGRDEDGNTDHFRAAWLTYSDVQKYFKRLRRDGYQFRYLVCGEYGSEKGRSHWHAIMFWENKVPEHTLTTDKSNFKRFHNEYWPHGHQVWERVHENSVRYVCKYINKDVGKDERQAHFSMSKKPPIGNRYFTQLAKKYVDAGLAPQGITYSFPEIKGRDGLPRKFYMADTTLYNFLEDYKTLWQRHKGGHHPNSTLIEDHDDAIARQSYLPEKDRFGEHRELPLGCEGKWTGKNPWDGTPTPYTKEHDGTRWWLMKNDEGRAWQKETKGVAERPLPPSQENQYGKAKRGPDEVRRGPTRSRSSQRGPRLSSNAR